MFAICTLFFILSYGTLLSVTLITNYTICSSSAQNVHTHIIYTHNSHTSFYFSKALSVCNMAWHRSQPSIKNVIFALVFFCCYAQLFNGTSINLWLIGGCRWYVYKHHYASTWLSGGALQKRQKITLNICTDTQFYMVSDKYPWLLISRRAKEFFNACRQEFSSQNDTDFVCLSHKLSLFSGDTHYYLLSGVSLRHGR